jgi:hypothetical protein
MPYAFLTEKRVGLPLGHHAEGFSPAGDWKTWGSLGVRGLVLPPPLLLWSTDVTSRGSATLRMGRGFKQATVPSEAKGSSL